MEELPGPFGEILQRLSDTTKHPDCLQDQNDKAGFLERRKKYLLTASEATAILNIQSYGPAAPQLARIKRGEEERPQPSDYARENFLQPGIDNEAKVKREIQPAVEEHYGKRGMILDVGTYLYQDPKTEATFGASPDGLFVCQVTSTLRNPMFDVFACLLEMKYFASKEEIPIMPLSHWVQMQMQMAATDVKSCLWVAESNTGEKTLSWVIVDREWMNIYFLPALRRFYATVHEGAPWKHEMQRTEMEMITRKRTEASVKWTRDGNSWPALFTEFFKHLQQL